MIQRLRLAPALLLPLALGACAAGERGLVSPHQPVVDAHSATVPGCPDWHDRYWTPSEGQSTNFGCATARNLAAMIADPNDLLHGKTGDGAGMGEVAVRAIRALNTQAGSGSKALDKVSAKSGG